MTSTLPRGRWTSADELARELKARGLPGRRSVATIRRLRRERRARNTPLPEWGNAEQRLHTKLLTEARAEILRRGGEVEIEGSGRPTPLHVADRDPNRRLVLVSAHGWRQYSRSYGARRASLAYLYGVDDAGPWAVRVPGTVDTVDDALAWLEPAEVTKARESGRRVWRQGDVYAIETTRAHDGRGADALPEGHRWNTTTRHLTHHPDDGRKHRPLRLPRPVRFVQQRSYGMGRGAGRACGD